MPNTHVTLGSLFSAIVGAIRAKTGSANQLVADNFPTVIAVIATGVNTDDATATSDDIVEGKTSRPPLSNYWV